MRIKQKDPMISKGGSHEEGTSRILKPFPSLLPEQGEGTESKISENKESKIESESREDRPMGREK